MAWPGMSFDEVDTRASALRTRLLRYPARPIILVTRIIPTSPRDSGAPPQKEIPTITVAADKQKAQLVEGSPVQPAPLWEPAGGTAKCKVLIGADGKISELGTGGKLCEGIPWPQFRYQAPLQAGKPVKVRTEVEVRYEPRK